MAKERSMDSILGLLGGARGRAALRTTAAAVVPSPQAKAPGPESKAGTELSLVAERQEGLVERVMGARGSRGPEEAREDLTALHGILQGLSQKTVVVIFAMGKLLAEVKTQLPHGDFIAWIEENCPFTRMSSFRYMAVYERYKDEPRRALAELSVSQAYIEAGVKKLSAPEQREEDEVHVRGGIDLGKGFPKASEYMQLFKKATMSGVPLKHYRILPYEDGSLYVVRPELGPIQVCELHMDMSVKDITYQDAVQEVHHNLQMALEVFYSKMEICEERGVINAPFDSSRPAMARRMRNVSPAKEETEAPPDPEEPAASIKKTTAKGATKGRKR
jgi:hypothetical protein